MEEIFDNSELLKNISPNAANNSRYLKQRNWAMGITTAVIVTIIVVAVVVLNKQKQAPVEPKAA